VCSEEDLLQRTWGTFFLKNVWRNFALKIWGRIVSYGSGRRVLSGAEGRHVFLRIWRKRFCIREKNFVKTLQDILLSQ
jgi:hypothetical protein